MKNNIWFEIIENNIPDYDIKCYVRYDNDGEQGIGTSMHNHKHIELLCVKRGSLECRLYGEETAVLGEGDVILINRMLPHETRTCSPDTGICVLQFVPSDFLALLGVKYNSLFEYGDGTYRVFRSGESSICDSMDDIYRENSERNNGYRLKILGSIYSIIGEIIRCKDVRRTARVSEMNVVYMERALSFIEDNCSRDISLPEIAEHTNLSVTHFSRLFKEFTGMSFITYLNTIRIGKAERLLCTTDKSVTEIAYSVGFSSSAYFDRVFKKHYKLSPAKYRDMINN